MLEDLVLDLYESEAAGIDRGDYEWLVVEVPAADLVRLTGRDADTAEAFLLDGIHRAKGMAQHWEGMLDGMIPTEGLPPVVAFTEDGPEIVDGEHRLAAFVLHAKQPVRIVVGIAPGSSLVETWPEAAGWTMVPSEEVVPAIPGFG